MEPFDFTYYRRSQAAEVLGIKGQTLTRWEEAGILLTLRATLGQWVTRRYVASYIDGLAARLGPLPDKMPRGGSGREQKATVKRIASSYKDYAHQTVADFKSELGQLTQDFEGHQGVLLYDIAALTGIAVSSLRNRGRSKGDFILGTEHHKGHITLETLNESLSVRHFTLTDGSLLPPSQSAQ